MGTGVGEAAPIGYRPWLDGVRAIAVVLVVASHTGGLPLPGLGETGVGAFFGLSGYLITGLLYDEYQRNGYVRLRDFYVRRAARLLPALFLMLIVCDALFVTAGTSKVLRSSLFAASYVANYATVVSGYLPGYSQTWSLAIEEHFYLLWPITLLFFVRRRSLNWMVRWALLGCGAALAWRFILVFAFHAQPRLLYHGTIERADALLYGCAAALAVRAGWRPRAWLGWCAVAVLAAVVVRSDAGRAGMTLVQAATGFASAALVSSLDYAPGVLRRLLSLRPLVWVGVMSYGIYLWHVPLIELVATYGHRSTSAGVVAGFVASPLAAAASFYALERPIRMRIRSRIGRTGDLHRDVGTPTGAELPLETPAADQAPACNAAAAPE